MEVERAVAPRLRIVNLPHGEGLSPTRATEKAAGFDLRAAVPDGAPLIVPAGAWAAVPTGLRLAIPPGFEGQVRPRSGLARDHGVTVLNAPGTIDADYRGELMVLLINHGTSDFSVARGMRIAQLVIAALPDIEIETAETLDETPRGAGGFGSTGRD
jgi:dUTP pyrophosphatase